MPCSLPIFTLIIRQGCPTCGLQVGLGAYYGNRQSPFRLIGPKGTLSLMQNLERAYADDIRIRSEDEKNPLKGVAVSASEYSNDGVVYDENGVKVTAFEVDHGPLIKPAYGYRIDFDGRSVIISGDTRYSENLEKHAQGATLVIHEVAIPNQDYYEKTPIVRYIMAHHISPEEAGALFARLRPETCRLHASGVPRLARLSDANSSRHRTQDTREVFRTSCPRF